MKKYELYEKGKIEGSYLRATFRDISDLEAYVKVLPKNKSYFIVEVITHRRRHELSSILYLIKHRNEDD